MSGLTIVGTYTDVPAQWFCHWCFEVKTPDDFWQGSKGSKRQVQCKACHRAANDAWLRANRERRKAIAHRYYLSRIDEHKRRANERRAREINAKCTVHAQCERINLTALFRGVDRCANCGKKVTPKTRHIDHKVPLAKGGVHCVFNLQVLCQFCNLSKGAKVPEQVPLIMLSEHPQVVARAYGWE